MRWGRTLAGRLFLWQVAVVLVVLFGVGVVLDRTLEQDFVNALTASLVSEARVIQRALPADPAALQPPVRELGQAGGVRVTVIRTDGVVLADSEHDPTTMENHLSRPEVQRALRSQVGTSSRVSATLGIAFRYVALPARDGVIVRVAVPLTSVDHRRATVRLAVAVGMLAAVGLTALGALLVSRGVLRPLRRATASLEQLGRGDLSARVEPAESPVEVAVLTATLNQVAERLAEELRSSAEEQRTRDVILSAMGDGVVLVDPDGRVRFSNPAARRHLGTPPDTVSGLTPFALQEGARQAILDHRAVEVEVETGTPVRSLHADAIPVDDEGSVLLVLRDVTESRRIDSIRRDFVTNASHELKTPAASIQAAAETIRTAVTEDPGVVPRFAEQIEREALRLSRIVGDLLDLSRLESGSELTELVHLDELAREELPRFDGLAESAGVEVSTELAATPPVRGSARDLSLLIRNLVDNAIRYTKPGGRVDVQARGEDGDVVLRVRDTGIGIPSRDLPRVFERFYRVDRARSRETGGTGLGLSIVKHVAENHGGTVSVESELGRGSTFEVRLPGDPSRLSSGR